MRSRQPPRARRPLARLSSAALARRTPGEDYLPVSPAIATDHPRDHEPLLTATDVAYGYEFDRSAAGALAVSGVSFAIPPGSFTGLLGPNGCGKTTLLKLLSGVLHPVVGTVMLF